MKRLITAAVTVFLLLANVAYAGSTGSEKLRKSSSSSANECFEGFSRAMFSFNQAVDATVFEPIAKGYRVLPMVIRNERNGRASSTARANDGRASRRLRYAITFANFGSIRCVQSA